ncbi:MAG: hypothetical protein ACOZD0_04505 [Pseudomonadota bacterium]
MNQKFGVNAETMNALATAIGALVFATVRALPQDARAAFARDLARMADARSQAGDVTGETLLMDLHRAATMAADPSVG